MCLHQPTPVPARPLSPSFLSLKEFVEQGIELAHVERAYRALTPGNDNPNQSTTKILAPKAFHADYYRFHSGPFYVVCNGYPLGLYTNWDNVKEASQSFPGSSGAKRRNTFDLALKWYLEVLYSRNVELRRPSEKRRMKTPSPSPSKGSTFGSPSLSGTRSRSTTQEPTTPRASGHSSRYATPTPSATVQSPGHSFDNPINLCSPTPPRLNYATKPTSRTAPPATTVTPAGAGSLASPTPAGICAPSSPTPAPGSSKPLKRKNEEPHRHVASVSSSAAVGPSSSANVEVVDNTDASYCRCPGYPTPLSSAISSLAGYNVGSHATPRGKAPAQHSSPTFSDSFDYTPEFFETLTSIERKAYSEQREKLANLSPKGKGVDRKGKGVDYA